jgi:hypothetical protein
MKKFSHALSVNWRWFVWARARFRERNVIPSTINKNTLTFLSLLVVALLLSQAQPQGIGLKAGDWARYEKRFYQQLTNNYSDPENVTYSDIRIIELQILRVEGTQLTYTQTVRLEKSSDRSRASEWLRGTFTVDPTKPIYPTYGNTSILENELNMMLAPSGLSAGDYLVEVVGWPNSVGNWEFQEWSQRVNSTTIEGDPLNPITVNHVEWSRDTHSVEENGQAFDFHEDKQLSFDQTTGLMLHSVIREEGIGYSNSGRIGRWSYIYDYRLIDSSAMPRNYTIAAITVASLLVAVFLVIRPRRKITNK